MHIRTIKKRLFLIALFVFISIFSQAQPGGGDDELDDIGGPIDGGAVLLVSAAAVYGWKKLRETKMRK